MKIGRVSIPFVKYTADVPVVNFRIGDDSLYAIIDTGAEVSLFDEKLKHSLKIVDQIESKFVGVSGVTENKVVPILLGELSFPASNGNIFITKILGMTRNMDDISSHYSELIGDDRKISCIIGGDFLARLKAKIDYVKQEITFKI